MSTEICQGCGKFTSYKTGGQDTSYGFMCRECLSQCSKCGEFYPDFMFEEKCSKCGGIIE